MTVAPARACRYPDFFVAGAARCGTTYLWGALRRHPGVFMPAIKEPHFFAADLDSGTQGEGRFRVRDEAAYVRLFEGARPDQLVGEASPTTISSAVAVEAILRVSPEARMIVSLRDPVEAIASRHARWYASGFEDLDLERAIEADADRAQGRRLPRRPMFPRVFAYVGGARHGEQLERLFQRVGRERVLVLLLDEIAADPDGTIRRAARFLGLADVPIAGTIDRNANRVVRSARLFNAVYAPRTIDVAKRVIPRPLCGVARRATVVFHRLDRRETKRPAMSPALQALLRERLREDLELTSRLLGEDLIARWWGRP